jgi:hypothetical protein
MFEQDCWTGALKMDNTRERAVCIYRREARIRQAIGGAKGYFVLPMRVLVRGGPRAMEASLFADYVHSRLSQADVISGYVRMAQEAPIPLGTDEKGVYEFSIEFDMYFVSQY